MSPYRKPYLHVFITKNFKTSGVIEDDIVEIEPGRFKSIKFRHTYYRTGDFVLTMDEVLDFIKTQKKVGSPGARSF